MITKAVGSRWKSVALNRASQRSLGSATSSSGCSTAAMLVIMIIIIIYTSRGSLDKLAKQFNDECEITKPHWTRVGTTAEASFHEQWQ